jgi:DNA-binding transcriptional regulator YiaG
MSTTTLTGHQAITYAEATGRTLAKHADPTEDARQGLSPDEARDVAAEDPGLVYIEIEDAQELDIYEDNGGTIWLVAEDEGVAVAMGSDPRDLADRALTDCRTWRDSWSPEEFAEDLRGHQDVEDLLSDAQTRHLATYVVREDCMDVHLDAHQMGRSGQAYMRLSLVDAPEPPSPEEIRDWRDRMGWTQDDASTALGIGRQHLSDLERGVKRAQGYLRLAMERLEDLHG